MKMTAQLFVREGAGLGENEYMVCGIIKSDEKLDKESVHVFNGEMKDLSVVDRKEIAHGNNFDGIMTKPIWRRFC